MRSSLSYKQRKNVCKIERFCSLVDYSVVGGFSKLLKHLEQNYLKPEITEIHNWVDLRYGTGLHLEDKGFKMKRETLGWKWTDFNQTFNRLKCRANMDERNPPQKLNILGIKCYLDPNCVTNDWDSNFWQNNNAREPLSLAIGVWEGLEVSQ